MVIDIYGFNDTSCLLIILSQVKHNPKKHYEVMMSSYSCGIINKYRHI